MSSLIVEVSRIQKLAAHPAADRIELAVLKGWQCVVPKGRYKEGQLVTYVPPDSVLPLTLSDRLGVTKYLSNGRVRCAKLRGEPSFGVIIDLEGEWAEGTDVREHYGITKYVPPIKVTAGDAEPDHPMFVSYTEIENMRNYPEVIHPGEEVVVSEKIHGTNSRTALINVDGAATWMAGSKCVRRKQPPEDRLKTDIYWFPYSNPGVKDLLLDLFHFGRYRQVVLFGEVYGKVQGLRYGVPNGLAFRAFDLLLDGKYADDVMFRGHCNRFGVETVPVLYRGPYDLSIIKGLAEGPSTIPGAKHIREGVVVRPVTERIDPKVGRVILKYVGDGYLLGDHSDTNDV